MTLRQPSLRTRTTNPVEANPPKFPGARYFQIHFEHLQSQLDDTKRGLEAVQQQLAQLQEQLRAQSAMPLSDMKK